MDLEKKVSYLEDKIVNSIEKRLLPEETVYERHAREQEDKEFFGERWERLATLYIPGVFGYKLIKDAQQKFITPKTPTSHKLAIYGMAVASELVLSAFKFGCAYGYYQWAKYLWE